MDGALAVKLELVDTGEGHVAGTNEAEVAVLLGLGVVAFLVLKIRSDIMIRRLKMSSKQSKNVYKTTVFRYFCVN